MTQKEMYDIRIICNAIQRNLEKTEQPKKMSHLTIRTRAETLLTKEKKKGTAAVTPLTTTSGEDSDPAEPED